MDAVMDLTARAVSFITLIQDTILRASLTYGNNELTQGLQDVYGSGFKEKFSNHIAYVKNYEKVQRFYYLHFYGYLQRLDEQQYPQDRAANRIIK